MFNLKSVSAKWMIAALVALVAAPAMGAPAAAEEARYMVVMDTPAGIVESIMTQSELDVALTCPIDSPNTPSCVNGPLPRLGASHGLALPIPSGFTSPVGNVPVHKMIFTSFLRSSANTERIFRCELKETPPPAGNGAVTFQCFPGSGQFPPVGSTMTQEAIALAAPVGGASDTLALQVYKATNGEIVIPGLGKATARLAN